MRRDVRPSSIITKASLENAAASVAATGGSTNGVLHLVAIAKELEIDFTIDDFDAISARTPIVADLKPFGRFVATDVHKAGGIALVARELKKAGLIDPTTPNVDGRTLGEIADAAVATEGQEVVVPIETPIKSRGRRRDPARQPRAGRLRRQARRLTSATITVARPACSTPRRRRSPPSRQGRSWPATSS